MSTDSACMARQRSSARPVIFEYFTPASGLNSNVVTTGPGWICTTDPATANSRHFSSSSRASSMSSRSSILRSVLGASSSASGGSAYSPLRRSAGALACGFGSESGRKDAGIVTWGGAGADVRSRMPACVAVLRRPRSARRFRGGRDASGKGEAPAAGCLISGAGEPFFVCLAMTSRRCFSRRRSSRHSRNEASAFVPALAAIATMPTNSRPKENCVERMIDSAISVRTTMTEPVRFRYSESCECEPFAGVAAGRAALPATSGLWITRLRNALKQASSNPAPIALVPAASSRRHQK